MWKDKRLCELLGIDHPIIQAPMAGASTPRMAIAAANAGGMGALGCAMQTADQIAEDMAQIRQHTNHAINLNFFVHTPPRQNVERAARAHERLANWYNRFDAGNIPEATETHYPFDVDMCDAMVNLSPKVVSFHFGLPDAAIITALKSAGITILSSATSVAEALYLQENGVDAIIAQGYEAGGHSGHFLPRGSSGVAGTMALVPRIVDAVNLPVIAAGGIADGRGIAAALVLGAAGVQIGTAFLATPESAASDTHKHALLNASGDDTMLSKAFSGRHARTLVNKFSTEMESVTDWPDFPIMNTLTGPIRKASVDANSPDAIALWSGQAAGLIRAASTAEVFEKLVSDTHAVDTVVVHEYGVFTRAFDMEIAAEKIDDVFGAGLKSKWNRSVKRYLKNSAATKDLARIAIEKALDARSVNHESESLNDTVVCLLLDHSGSMRGDDAELVCTSAEITADCWSRMGLRYEILGFTTSSWKGGRSREAWVSAGRPPLPGRLCDLLHIIYRSADSTEYGAPESIRKMLRHGFLKENIDGEAILWAAERLRSRPEKRKILLVISDGAPVDDSTLAANFPRILEDHIRSVILGLEYGAEIEIAAIGIGYGVGRYYKHSMKINSADGLVTDLPKFLTTLIP